MRRDQQPSVHGCPPTTTQHREFIFSIESIISGDSQKSFGDKSRFKVVLQLTQKTGNINMIVIRLCWNKEFKLFTGDVPIELAVKWLVNYPLCLIKPPVE